MKPLNETQKRILLRLYRRGQAGCQFAGDGGIGRHTTAQSLCRRELAYKHGARHYIDKAGRIYAEAHYPTEITKP